MRTEERERERVQISRSLLLQNKSIITVAGDNGAGYPRVTLSKAVSVCARSSPLLDPVVRRASANHVCLIRSKDVGRVALNDHPRSLYLV